jgi:hypothetical protein
MDLPFIVIAFFIISFGVPAVLWIAAGIATIVSKLFGGKH